MKPGKPDPKWIELQQLVKTGAVRTCIKRDTGVIHYYLPEHEKNIDWNGFDKLQ